MIDLSLRDKIWKKSKIIAIVIVVFWLLIVSINVKRIFNISDYVEDESSNLSTSQLSESQIGQISYLGIMKGTVLFKSLFIIQQGIF